MAKQIKLLIFDQINGDKNKNKVHLIQFAAK